MRANYRIWVSVCLICAAVSAQAELTVFAAASLRGALDEVHQSYEGRVVTSYASSAALARQIAQGAPADVFISANAQWMGYLEDLGEVQPSTKVTVLGNRLALVGHQANSDFEVNDLPKILSDTHLAMGFVNAVPAGIYGKQSLTSLDLWSAVQPHVVQTDHVRAALNLVVLKEVDFALVYATDALAEPAVSTLAHLPEETHDPIRYPAAQVTEKPEAAAYLAYLQGPDAQAIFARHGFLTEGLE